MRMPRRRGIGELVGATIVISVVLLVSLGFAGYIKGMSRFSEVKTSTALVSSCSTLLSGNSLFISATISGSSGVHPEKVIVYDYNLTKIGEFNVNTNGSSISGKIQAPSDRVDTLVNKNVLVVVEYKSTYTRSISGTSCFSRVEAVS